MGYLSLYRKWRPKTFDDLAGQTTVVKTLKNALINNRIAHAYLFCGPRGTGKTSTAKLFAKALNCEQGPTIKPCDQCFSCEQINTGRSVDVIEIDAASNRRIDEIRDLREKVKFSPSEGDYKVYIIDEVHMLTKEAFNALLKTLEEPPQNVVFILATTEPHKILPTIISRCQRFDFGLLSVRDLKFRMRYICDEEGVTISDDALTMIARTAEGGMRDAISILDQAIAYGGNEVTVEDVNSILGKVDQRVLSRIVEIIAGHDSQEALLLVNEILDQGKDMNQFLKDLLFHFRDLMLIRECGVQNTVIELPDELKLELAAQAEKFTTQELLRILKLLSEADQQLKFASQPRLVLEMVLIKLASKEADLTMTNLVNRLAKLEEMLENGQWTTNQSEICDKLNDQSTVENKDNFADKVQKVREKGFEQRKTNIEEQHTVAQSDQQKVAQNKELANNDMIMQPKETGQFAETVGDNSTPLITLSELENYWQVTLDLLGKYSETRQLKAFLLNGKPYTVIGDTFYIVYPSSSTFHKTHAEEKINFFERALKKVTGVTLRAVCIYEGEEPDLGRYVRTPEATELEAQESSEYASEMVQQDVIVQKALKIFGGRIIQVENE